MLGGARNIVPPEGTRGVSVRFTSRPNGRVGLKRPIPSRSELESYRTKLWDSAPKPWTADAYGRSLHQWSTFTASLNLSDTPTVDSLSLFVAWRLSTTSKTTYSTLSGLAYHLKPRMGASAWDAVRVSPEVKQAIRGTAKLQAHQQRRAPPLRHSTS